MSKKRTAKIIEYLRRIYEQLQLNVNVYDAAKAIRVFELWFTDTRMRPQLNGLYGVDLYPVLNRLFKELGTKGVTLEDIEKYQQDIANDWPISKRNQVLCGCYALAFVVGPMRYVRYGGVMAKLTAKCE